MGAARIFEALIQDRHAISSRPARMQVIIFPIDHGHFVWRDREAGRLF